MLKSLYVGLLAALIMLPASSLAQFDPGANLISLNVGYVNGAVKNVEDRYDGWGFNGAFDRVLTNNQWSVGFGVAYLAATLTTTIDSNGSSVKSDVSTTPVFVTAKYNAGNKTARAYAGLGLGFAKANIDKTVVTTSGVETFSRITDPGFSMAIPLGVFLRLNDKAYINVNYTPYFVFDNDIIDGATHILSLGFTFPD